MKKYFVPFHIKKFHFVMLGYLSCIDANGAFSEDTNPFNHDHIASETAQENRFIGCMKKSTLTLSVDTQKYNPYDLIQLGQNNFIQNLSCCLDYVFQALSCLENVVGYPSVLLMHLLLYMDANVRNVSHMWTTDYVYCLCLYGLDKLHLYDIHPLEQTASVYLTQPTLYKKEFNQIMMALARNIDTKDRINFYEFMQKFLSKDMSPSERSGLIHSLSAYVSPSDRSSFFQYIQILIQKDMTCDDVLKIVHSIAKYISIHDRDQFLNYLFKFINPSMNGYYVANIIEALAIIPPGLRQIYAMQIRSYLTDDMHDYIRMEIICAFMIHGSFEPTPYDTLGAISDIYGCFFQNTYTPTLARLKLIQHHPKLSEMIKKALPFIKGLNFDERWHIVTSFLDMNLANKGPVIPNDVSFLKHYDMWERLHFIYCLYQHNTYMHVHPESITYTLNFSHLFPNMPIHNFFLLLNAFERLPAHEKESLFNFALSHHITCDEIQKISYISNPKVWEDALHQLRNNKKFSLNNQTIHEDPYEISIQDSIKRLETRYQTNEYKDFHTLMLKYEHKIHELNALNYLEPAEQTLLTYFFKHRLPEIQNKDTDTVIQYLNLVWWALHDRSALSNFQHTDMASVNLNCVMASWLRYGPLESQIAYILDDPSTTTYTDLKKLLRFIAEDRYLLKKGQACLKGTLNRFIDGLHFIHPDVRLIHGIETQKNQQRMWIEKFFTDQGIQFLRHHRLHDQAFLETNSADIFKSAKEYLKTALLNSDTVSYDRLSDKDIESELNNILLYRLNLDP